MRGDKLQKLFSRPARSFAAILTAVTLAGCAGYQLGPTGDRAPGSRSVQIVPFRNLTMEPRLIDAISSAVRSRLQQDGTYTLDTKDAGDIIVRGEITKFDDRPLSFQPKDTLTAIDFTLTITAHVTAIERYTGRTNLDTKVTGQTVVRVGSDETSTIRQAIPLLADDLARNLIVMLAEGPW
jgi:hypothetical protein